LVVSALFAVKLRLAVTSSFYGRSVTTVFIEGVPGGAARAAGTVTKMKNVYRTGPGLFPGLLAV
jgi:hypothetical protein